MMKDNNTYHCELILLNKDEWVQHSMEMVKSRGIKSDEEVLRDIVTFDFKFGTIQTASK